MAGIPAKIQREVPFLKGNTIVIMIMLEKWDVAENF